MNIIAFILNLPWTILGMISSIFSFPHRVEISWKPFAFVIYVRSFWWWRLLGFKGNPRAIANGHCVQIGPRADEADLPHELIHVEQAIREPFIHPILYMLETRKNGYRNNKYEVEAYSRSGSRYEN